MNKYYAGIGSRQTPKEIQKLMTDIAMEMARRGWALRSGGADGADMAFELGAKLAEGSSTIYLPWETFNHESRIRHLGYSRSRETLVVQPTKAAESIAASNHPAWQHCSSAAKLLHMRNVYQVMGHDLNTQSQLIICWTRNASGNGGTGQAIRIARKLNIPVFDLADPAHLADVKINLNL